MIMVVYRCYDNKEEEACFIVKDVEAAKTYLDKAPGPPGGFHDRPGYYFFEGYHEDI